jgi:cyclophilin family peptidyl-prolyl cis-trans isomerase
MIAFVVSASIGSTAFAKGTPGPRHRYAQPPKVTIDRRATYTATIETSQGSIVIDLKARAAPVAVNNFVFLAQQHFYDRLTFHRVATNFVIQGGDPTGNGFGGPGYTVRGEVPKPKPGQPAYPVGAVAMAKAAGERAGTSGSQFFIVTSDEGATLPPAYALIGQVTGGLDVVERIDQLHPASGDGPPTIPVIITAVTIAVVR